MITLNDPALYDRLRLFIAHGIPRKREIPWEREVVSAGMNLRMSQIAAALGLTQLKKLEKLNSQRGRIAGRYSDRFRKLPGVSVPDIPSDRTHVYQMYTLLVDSSIRNSLVQALNQRGVEASVHFDPPVHLHPGYREDTSVELPNTERLAREILSLPIYPDMTDSETDVVVEQFESLHAELV